MTRQVLICKRACFQDLIRTDFPPRRTQTLTLPSEQDRYSPLRVLEVSPSLVVKGYLGSIQSSDTRLDESSHTPNSTSSRDTWVDLVSVPSSPTLVLNLPDVGCLGRCQVRGEPPFDLPSTSISMMAPTWALKKSIIVGTGYGR